MVLNGFKMQKPLFIFFGFIIWAHAGTVPQLEVSAWQVNKTLAQSTEYLFRHKAAADVKITVVNQNGPSGGTPRIFLAHRILLMARSPVFFDLLNDEINTVNELMVSDVEPDAFNEMLRYIYYDTIKITAENVLYIRQAAQKYQFPPIAVKCSTFLNNKLDTTNVFAIYEHSMHFNDDWLTEKCLDMIVENGKVALKSEPFGKLTFTALEKFLDVTIIQADEIDIFNAVLLWGQKECERQSLPINGSNLREVISSNLYKIRFPTMELKEFANVVVPTDVLNAEEGYSVFKYLVCDEKPENMPFHVTKRVKVENDVWFIKEGSNSKFSTKWSTRHATIQISHAIKLKEVYFSVGSCRSSVFTLSLQVTQNGATLFDSGSKTYPPSSQKPVALTDPVKETYYYVLVALGSGITIAKGEFKLTFSYSISSMCSDVTYLTSGSTHRFGDSVVFDVNSDDKSFIIGVKYMYVHN